MNQLSLATLFLYRKLYEVNSDKGLVLILVKNYIGKLRKAKKVDINFKVFEQIGVFEPPTIYSLHKCEIY